MGHDGYEKHGHPLTCEAADGHRNCRPRVNLGKAIDTREAPRELDGTTTPWVNGSDRAIILSGQDTTLPAGNQAVE